MIGEYPLVGRREELAQIRRLLSGRESSGVVIAAAAGVGKTRLAAEAMRAAGEAGCGTAWATATRAAASIPFGAVAHLLPSPGPGPAGRLDLLRQAGRSLTERFARGHRLVLAIDDAHLLDEASAALTHQLAATGTAFVILTLRSGAPNLDPILALWKDGLATYLELRPLGQAEVSRLAGASLGGHVEGATLRRLWEATQGNALFLRELIEQGLERGTLSDAGGIWRWTGSIEPGARLGEIVEARLGRLTDDQLDALELVALGEPIGLSLLERLAAPGSAEQLQRRGLLSVEPGGRRLDVRLAHPMYGEALRARTRFQRGIAARLGDALAATGARRREDVLRLAGWRLDAGAGGPPELFVAAAWRALASFEPALAERLARAATAGGGFAARQVLGSALAARARFADAEAVLAELTPMTASEAERASLADARAANLFWGLGRPGQAERVLVQAEAQLGDSQLRDELAVTRGAFSAFLGRPAEALAVSRPILARGGTVGRACARAGLVTMTALILTGGSAEARAVIGRLREPALRLAEELPYLPRQLLGAYSVVLGLAGWLEESAAEAERGYERALADHSHEGTALWAMILGRALLGRGEIRGARALLQEGAALFAEADPIGFGAVCRAVQAQAHAQAGDRAGAEQALAQAEAAARGPGFRLFDAELGLARAWTAAAGGEFSQARAHALRTAENAEHNGQPAYAALAWHELARLGDPARASGALRAHAGALDGPLPPAYAAHGAALAAGDPGALDDAATAFEAAGAWLLAAEACAEAAAAHRDRGRAASAARSAARARLLAERCQQARTPALARAGPAAVLTRREHEVAALAAGGLSNRAIADRLSLSVRTVEHHLQHAYDKLGVRDRSQLEGVVRVAAAPARVRDAGA